MYKHALCKRRQVSKKMLWIKQQNIGMRNERRYLVRNVLRNNTCSNACYQPKASFLLVWLLQKDRTINSMVTNKFRCHQEGCNPYTAPLPVKCCPEYYYTSPISSHHGRLSSTATFRCRWHALLPKSSLTWLEAGCVECRVVLFYESVQNSLIFKP